MRLLCSGDGRVVKIVQKNVDPTSSFRLSHFVYAFEKEDAVAMKHTLTKQVLLLTREEWSALRTGTLSAKMREELARLRFLVEPDEDETSQYITVLSVLRIMEKRKPGIESYTILPTTGCNARCIYCYEEGWQAKTMSAETADAVVEFICRTKRKGKIRLDWFGGEPLCGAGTISRICAGLRNRGVAFYSTVITNATILTPELVKEAVKCWNLQRAQVSMDGAKADYERRKRYVRPKLHNYETAMEAVKLLSEAGVNVMLRCNYDAENLPRVKEFFDDCKARFSGRDNISYYMEQLFQSSGVEENAALFRSAAEVAAHLDRLGLASTERMNQRLKIHYCMADSGDSGVIIDPLGGLHVCEHDIEGKPFGTIFDQTLSWPSVDADTAEECRDCCFLPDCTPFRKDRCLLKIAACKMQMAIRTERSLTALLSSPPDGSESVGDDETPEGECP
ncbi:MAG: radical SAM protein [Oscillospiraceae bacterium]|nr:radical SAM protein [Oscillospiraceae bacterium]